MALYWAQEMAKQEIDRDLSLKFSEISGKLLEKETVIFNELLDAQGRPVNVGGYYLPDPVLAERAMRPSLTLNEIVSGI